MTPQRLGLLGALVWASVLCAQSIPTALVERHRTVGNTTTRITLFDNRMAVTTVREGEKQVFLRQLALEEAEYEVYFQVLEEVGDSARGERQSSLDNDDSKVTISLDLPGRSPRQISFSPLQVLGLETNRLMAALDDLERRVAETSPSHEALRTWKPKRGDRVELFTGTMATVDEVRESGVIVLIHDVTGIIEIVPGAEASRVIMRVDS